MEIRVSKRHGKAEGNAERGKRRHDDGGLNGAAADACMLARAQVLRGEAGKRGAEGVERRHGEVIELVGRAKPILRGA